MREFQDKRRRKKLLHSKWVAFSILGISLFLMLADIGLYEKWKVAHDKKELAENQLANYEKKLAKVESNIAELSSGEGLERTIRQEYSVAQEGEKVVVVSTESARKNDVRMRDVPWYESLWFSVTQVFK